MHLHRYDEMRIWTDAQLRSHSPPKPETWQEAITDLEISHARVPGLVWVIWRTWRGLFGSISCCGANENTWPKKAGTKTPEASGCPSCGSKLSREKCLSNRPRVEFCLPNLRCSQLPADGAGYSPVWETCPQNQSDWRMPWWIHVSALHTLYPKALRKGLLYYLSWLLRLSVTKDFSGVTATKTRVRGRKINLLPFRSVLSCGWWKFLWYLITFYFIDDGCCVRWGTM